MKASRKTGKRTSFKGKSDIYLLKTHPNHIDTVCILGSPIHDSGCNFKIMKRKGLKDSLPKGQIHRFLPEIFLAKGFKVTEIPVSHFPRLEGKSKYGFERIIRGFGDSWLFFFWQKSSQKLFSRE